MLQNSGIRLKVLQPPGTRFESPLVHMLSPRSLRDGWARPIDAADAALLRRNAQVLTQLRPRPAKRP
ncbi:MAG TPA: hypothetical protein VI197_03745 [Polyangiaceae bacterium]